MININGYEIANKIADADEVEMMEFNFSDCFTALHEYERLKKQNDQLIKVETKLYAEIESEIEFLKELREDSHTEYQITLLDEKIEQKQGLLAESRGE